ncbi:MAG TPA: Bax inhibitor-1/YccA family protein [bacterium]|nr:Bax inhibitor-1/YccA family protein [bacterium]HPP86729.1 Bax inhibitor-1/YccA family protein [bacterium]
MGLFNNSNPVFSRIEKSNVWQNYGAEIMSFQGTINKTLILLALVIICAAATWQRVFSGATANLMLFMIGGAIGAFVFALITIFKPNISSYTAPLYAVCEGLLIGVVSAFFELRYPGIVMQAVVLTFGVLFLMLLIYKTGIIKVTQKFVIGVAAATGAIALFYFVAMILSFFKISVPLVYSSSLLGIIFSVVVVVVAALNLLIDFEVIYRSVENRSPKYMEWYCSFGLLVTLIWLYIEILRLLSKLNDRR